MNRSSAGARSGNSVLWVLAALSLRRFSSRSSVFYTELLDTKNDPKSVSGPTAKLREDEVNMLIFDQLKRNEPQLRLVALGIVAGLGILVAGLWWVQIVSSRDYQAHMETQAFRTV